MFDTLGNYLYCSECIRSALGISKDRLTRQRNIKCLQSRTQISKSEIEKKGLGAFVLMPLHLDESFNKWWRSEDQSSVMQVRMPHERHGNAGKASNSAKTTVHQDFIEFVDMNTQPNGRSAGPTPYFLPKFTTIQAPKPSVSNYNERLSRSVVGEFNRVQCERGRGECSNGSSHNWLKAERPKVAICPDYCDTCSKYKVEIHAKQTTINRLLQSANASPNEVVKLESKMKSLKQQHEEHTTMAQKSHHYYSDTTTKCAAEWEKIVSLEMKGSLTRAEKVKLTRLKK